MLEAGNLNVPALAGWLAALQEWQGADFHARRQRLQTLATTLRQGLAAIDHLRVHGSCGPLPIASVTIEGLAPADVAAILDAEYGIETRAGKHCAALIHKFIGSAAEGTLRISASHATTEDEIEAVVQALRSLVGHLFP
jgi:cysteine desulfurase / selenocysteine lyase